MNKTILVFAAGITLAFYIGFLVSSFENEKQFEITSEKQLSLALDDVRDRIKAKIPITVDTVLSLVDGNVGKYYVFDANKMIEKTYSQSYDEPYDTFFFENGTRSFTEMNDDGVLLKKITIHDVPENPIMVLVLED